MDGGEEGRQGEGEGAPPPLAAEATMAPEWNQAATVEAWEAEERAASWDEGEEQWARREREEADADAEAEAEAEAEAAMAMQWADADDDDLEDNNGLWGECVIPSFPKTTSFW